MDMVFVLLQLVERFGAIASERSFGGTMLSIDVSHVILVKTEQKLANDALEDLIQSSLHLIILPQFRQFH